MDAPTPRTGCRKASGVSDQLLGWPQPDEVAEFSGLKNGLHANAAKPRQVLAINPALVDMERANAEFPPFPEFTVNTAPVHTAFFFTSPGSVHRATNRAPGATRAPRRPKRRALSAGRRPLDARRAGQHREDVRRNAMNVKTYVDRLTMSGAAARHAARVLRNAIATRGGARIIAATGASQFDFSRR